MLTLLALLVGCGNPCQDYVDAATACYNDYIGATDSDAGDAQLVSDSYCDAYVSTNASDAVLSCETDAYKAHDCTTADGYGAAATEVAACATAR